MIDATDGSVKSISLIDLPRLGQVSHWFVELTWLMGQASWSNYYFGHILVKSIHLTNMANELSSLVRQLIWTHLGQDDSYDWLAQWAGKVDHFNQLGLSCVMVNPSIGSSDFGPSFGSIDSVRFELKQVLDWIFLIPVESLSLFFITCQSKKIVSIVDRLKFLGY